MAARILREAKAYLNGPEDRVAPVVQGLRECSAHASGMDLDEMARSESRRPAAWALEIAADLERYRQPDHDD